MKKYKNTLALLSAVLLLFISGCRENPITSSSSDILVNTVSKGSRDYITLLYSSSDTFNPYTAATDINRQLCRLLYAPLIKLDNSFNVNYILADKIDMNGTTCTVTLKNKVFSDGSQLSAEDVVYSFNLAKKTSTEYAYKLYEAVSASAQGAKTVIFKLSKADPYFANLLDFPILKENSDNRTDSDSVKLPPIGCGRYMLNEDRSKLTLNNKTLEKTDSVSVKEIQLINAPDDESVSHYVEIGAADMHYSDISDGNILRMSGKKIDINLNRLIYIGVNYDYGDLSLETLRQAISSGIDRSVVCRDGYYNNAIAANGFFNPVWEAVKSVQNIELQANKEITVENLEKIGYNSLDSNGIRKSSNGSRLKFELLVNKENRLRVAAAKLIANQLSEFGIKIIVAEKAFEEYTEALKTGNFQLYLGEVAITPNMDISNLVLEGGSAAYGIKNTVGQTDVNSQNQDTENTGSDSVESAASAAELIKGLYESKNTVTDVASVLQTEMPFIPVCYRTGVLFCNDNIENVNNSSASDIYFSIESYKINIK